MKADQSNTIQFGFIAQEVKYIFSTIVSQTSIDNSSIFGLSYTGLLPYLIRAFQEQHMIVEKNQTHISTLSSNNKSHELTASTFRSIIQSNRFRISTIQNKIEIIKKIK